MDANVVSMGFKPEDTGGNLSVAANYRKLTYVVVYDRAVYNVDDILLTPNAPFVGFEFPWNDSLRCFYVEAIPDKNPTVWYLEAEFAADTLVVEEGYGYDFRPRPIAKDGSVRGAYWHSNTALKEGDDDYKEVEYKESPDYPIVMSTGNPPNEPTMGVTYDTQFTWWQIETKTMSAMIDSGDFHQWFGSTNREEITICGQTFDPHTIELKLMEPEVYFYRPPGSTRSEQRYKCTYTIERALKTTGARFLDQDFQARLEVPEEYIDTEAPDYDPPLEGDDEGRKALRDIRLADLPENKKPPVNSITGNTINDPNTGMPLTGPKITLFGANDDKVSDPIKLDGRGGILEEDAESVYWDYHYKPSLKWGEILDMASKRKVC